MSLLFILLQNPFSKTAAITEYSSVLHPEHGWLPGSPFSCECLSEAVLLTPQRQHGSLAQTQCCELKLWLWRHVGGRSYAVSSFFLPLLFLFVFALQLHSTGWPLGVGRENHQVEGGQAQKAKRGVGARFLCGGCDGWWGQRTAWRRPLDASLDVCVIVSPCRTRQGDRQRRGKE